jgi:hypothetical protein
VRPTVRLAVRGARDLRRRARLTACWRAAAAASLGSAKSGSSTTIRQAPDEVEGLRVVGTLADLSQIARRRGGRAGCRDSGSVRNASTSRGALPGPKASPYAMRFRSRTSACRRSFDNFASRPTVLDRALTLLTRAASAPGFSGAVVASGFAGSTQHVRLKPDTCPDSVRLKPNTT